jgi:predicted nucleic acid-binding protein
MKEVFVDTSGWVALKHKGDTFWKAATALNRALLTGGVRYVTSNFVLDETYTLLLYRAGHHVAVEFGDEIRASRLVSVVRIGTDWEEEAWRLFRRYNDKAFSYTDCTSFVVMRHYGISEAFTNDHHFEQAGYKRLLNQTQ